MRRVVGIDEAGRGPLAGPVAVGIVYLSSTPAKNLFKNIKDSKKLSVRGRERWFEKALEARQKGLLDFTVVLVSEKVIDRRGLTHAVKLGVERGLKTLKVSNNSTILLDSGLSAPAKFRDQKSFIKGDEKIAVISLASIVAKVTRDRRMVKMAKKFPEFDFHQHKGYGTLKHREALKKYGPTNLHRRSFLKKFNLK